MTQRHNIKETFLNSKKNKINGYYYNKKNKNYFIKKNYYFDNYKIVSNWKKIFKKDFIYLKFEKRSEQKIFFYFLNILKIDQHSNFKIPEKKNVSRKIKFWNLKRVFYLLYLNYFQKKIFSQSQLDHND